MNKNPTNTRSMTHHHEKSEKSEEVPRNRARRQVAVGSCGLPRSAAMSLQHNTYFDGGVQSIGYEREGARQSVGVMAAGEYHFGTDAPERMTVVSGELVVKLPGSDDWQAFGSGTSFDVPGSSGFDLQVASSTAYLCEYL